MVTESKKKDGRNEPVLVRLPDDLMKRLDVLRRAQDDLPTRPAMIRRILAEWMGQNASQEGPSDRDD